MRSPSYYYAQRTGQGDNVDEVRAGAEQLETWLDRSLRGDESAWVSLLGHLWAEVEGRVRGSRFMGQLRGSDDDRREVVTRVFARLRRNDLRALRSYPAWRSAHPDKTFDDWLTIVVTNVIRDYVAERLGDIDDSGAGLKRLVNTLAEVLEEADELPRRPPMTNTIAAAQLIAAAKRCLPEDQQHALAAWLSGAEVDRGKVRAALARLRREFREDES